MASTQEKTKVIYAELTKALTNIHTIQRGIAVDKNLNKDAVQAVIDSMQAVRALFTAQEEPEASAVEGDRA